MTISDLSKKIGLSTATISRALNNESNVTEETKRIVLEAVKTFGYVPKTTRCKSKNKVNDMVMIITGSLTNPVHLNLVTGIETELAESGKHAVVVQTNYKEDLQTRFLQYAVQMKFSCIMILNAIENSSLIRFLNDPASPLVIFVNRTPVSVEVESVTMDNFRSGTIAARKLVENGHSRIMVLSGPEDSTVCNDRIQGFRSELEEQGISFNSKAVFHGDRSYEYGLSVGNTIAGLPQDLRPTGVYCLSGTMTEGFLDALSSNDIHVPEDISIICNDNPNTYFAEKMSVTSIEIDFVQMGVVAAKRYLEIINSDDKMKKQIMFMPTIYVRKSIRNIRGDESI